MLGQILSLIRRTNHNNLYITVQLLSPTQVGKCDKP